MPYLLDGNNLIGGVRRTSRPSAEDRTALVAEIAQRLRSTRAKATIYFDGPAGERPAVLGSLTVRVASGGSADDAIVREVERSGTPAEIVVVTDDRELRRRVRDAGGRICAAAEFFERFGQGPRASEGKGGSHPIDVEEWIRYFGDERNRE